MKLVLFRHENAWHVRFEGSMALPFKHLDTAVEFLRRKYPEAEIVEPEAICGTSWEKPNHLKLVKGE
jgi:hypothetical protein